MKGPSAPSEEIITQANLALCEKVFAHSRSCMPAPAAKLSTTMTGRQKPRHGVLAASKVCLPDFIAVGARGTSRFRLTRVGSVSRAVVHAGQLPVLVGRQHEQREVDHLRVLVACDTSETNASVSAFLNRLAWPAKTAGQVVHVHESLFAYGVPDWLEEEALASESDPLAQAYIHQQEKQVGDWAEMIEEQCRNLPAPFQGSEPIVVQGHTGDQIVNCAKSGNVDLVVVGSRCLGVFGRLFAGSTGEYVLNHVDCSVLIVPQCETP